MSVLQLFGRELLALIRASRTMNIPGDSTLRRSPSPQESRVRVIAIVEEKSTTQRCLIAAAYAAKSSPELTIAALHICVDPERIAAPPEEISIQRNRIALEGTAGERAKSVRQSYNAWLRASHVQADWIEQVGQVGASIVAESVDVALFVIPEPQNLDARDALHAALFHSKAPVLYLPLKSGMGTRFLENIAVVWNSTSGAQRAIDRCAIWLRAAELVTVLDVDLRGTSSAQAIEAFRAKEIAADIDYVRLGHRANGERALLEARRRGVSSLVLSAYPRGQLLEAFFGGFTSDLLQKAKFPLFLARR